MHDVFIHNAVIHDGERFTDADALLVKAGRISWIDPGACAPAHDGVPSVDLEGRPRSATFTPIRAGLRPR